MKRIDPDMMENLEKSVSTEPISKNEQSLLLQKVLIEHYICCMEADDRKRAMSTLNWIKTKLPKRYFK